MTKKKTQSLPRVSICTPTFNRRPFFKGLIASVLAQKYPKELIEWIIVDDGTDKIGDLVSHIPFVKYIQVEERMTLGKKRNFMHQQCSFKEETAIIVYMDDDDYYPPERISHSVDRLIHSNALCSGASELYIWFNTLNKMYKFGPYGPNHATAGTFAFKRKLLESSEYEDSAILAEEKFFLKNYTVPFIQLDPLKTILVFSHEQNTFDKRRLIDPNNPYCKESALKVNHFVKSDEMRNFYMTELNDLINHYEPGDIKNKPEVLEEIKRRDELREQMSRQGQPMQVTINNPDGTKRVLTPNEIVDALKFKTEEVRKLFEELETKNRYVNLLIDKLRVANERIKTLEISNLP
jgi:glycosyltransferase involved in cell wall biosynthesis